MEIVTLKISDKKAREYSYFLRQKYGRSKSTNLTALVRLTVLDAVAQQAELEAREAGKESYICPHCNETFPTRKNHEH